jgi:hypothetical protein
MNKRAILVVHIAERVMTFVHGNRQIGVSPRIPVSLRPRFQVAVEHGQAPINGVRTAIEPIQVVSHLTQKHLRREPEHRLRRPPATEAECPDLSTLGNLRHDPSAVELHAQLSRSTHSQQLIAPSAKTTRFVRWYETLQMKTGHAIPSMRRPSFIR